MILEPLISIIIPAYNVETYIDQCIKSVLNQTYKNYEIILVDDGATDNTGSICDMYGKNENIKVIHKKNGGLSDARNVGLELAGGKYVMFLDSDDYWNDTYFLKKIHERILSKDVDLIVFGYNKILNQKIIDTRIPTCNATDICDLVRKDAFDICAWDKVIKRSLLTNNEISFRKNVYSEDMEWCSKVFSTAKSCCVLSEAPYSYRQREGSITKTLSNKNIQDVRDNYKRCIEIQKSMNEDYQIAFNYFLAKNFSMFLIAITQIDKHERKKYYSFINQNKYILRYYSRNREKMIYICLLCFGISFTESLIGWIYKRRG